MKSKKKHIEKTGKTFAEKIFGAKAGSIVFKKPDIILSHDNTNSIYDVFIKMNGSKVANPEQLLVVLDHNAPPTSAKLANDYQKIREIVNEQGISKFHDAGKGISHQIMAEYAKPGMLIVGSDSHTCTAGAFNAFAAGIDRTETAGLWKQGETWFRVPESIKIVFNGNLNENVYAKDLSLWIIGILGSSGADYQSIEFHGPGLKSLSVSEWMTLANLASEMGAKNAVFPCDEVLQSYLGECANAVWADADAKYSKEIEIDLNEISPLIAVPHQVDNVKTLSEVAGTKIHQALVGTCANGRYEDLEIVANILKGKKLPSGFQMLIVPASQKIYLEALKKGLIEVFIEAGAHVLASSCGPCLGTGQGIPADNYNVISTANRNFKGRMGNKNANIYLASPAVVAHSALAGEIIDLKTNNKNIKKLPFVAENQSNKEHIIEDKRYFKGVWNYKNLDNLNTDLMFAGNLTYNINSADAELIVPHLFAGFDSEFAQNVKFGDIIIAGDNFGCGSSREHPAVGLRYVGIKAILVKSVNRIFYRSAINQGLPLIILPQAVESYRAGDKININLVKGEVEVNANRFYFEPLPSKLMEIFEAKGLVNYIRNKEK